MNNNDTTETFYFLPHSADPADPDSLRIDAVSFAEVQNTMRNLKGKALVFMDACHSGNLMATQMVGGSPRSRAEVTGVVNELSSAERGVVVFCSSTGRQFSLEKSEWGNGAFTKAVVEGLGGKADYTGKRRVTVKSLDLYVSDRVATLTDGRQTPVSITPQTVPDFLIAVVRD